MTLEEANRLQDTFIEAQELGYIAKNNDLRVDITLICGDEIDEDYQCGDCPACDTCIIMSTNNNSTEIAHRNWVKNRNTIVDLLEPIYEKEYNDSLIKD